MKHHTPTPCTSQPRILEVPAIALLCLATLCSCGGTIENPRCGNGAIDPGEVCDGANLGIASCETAGNYTGGTLACANDCTFDISGCVTPPGCGDSHLATGEECDGTDLGGATCETLGRFSGGSLACNPDCTFDTTGCTTPPACGNGVLDPGEECDGDDLASASCETAGSFYGGFLACSPDCTFDTTGCTTPPACGNGVIDLGEDCDGDDLGSAGCGTVGGFSGGSLACNRDCTFDTSGCTTPPACGNGIIDPGEDCDGDDLGSAGCVDLGGFTGGALACTPDCLYDTSGCTGAPPLDLEAAGYLDVTTFGADPTGQSVSTEALQQALDAARAGRRVAFFPAGTYLVDDTLRCMEPNDGGFGCVLVGSARGPRPLIRLADDCPGFDDDSVTEATVANGIVTVRPTIKPVVHFWRQQTAEDGGSTDPEFEDGSRNYNQVIRNIDIDLGEGNPGAVGIRHWGAEGSSIQEVRIEARSGFAGVTTFPASGGAPFNLEIVGGRYGIHAPKARGGASVIAGLRLSGQREQPIVFEGQYPLVLVGFEIEHDHGPVYTTRNRWHDCSGHLSLIDGTIDITGDGSEPVVQNTDRSIYMQNVYVRGAANIVRNTADGSVLAAPAATSWTRIDEYAYIGSANDIHAVIDGAVTSATITSVMPQENDPPADLIERHVFPEHLCSFEDPAAVNVKDFGAAGDGVTDDTEALRAAIATADKVLLPKGSYRVSATIDLRSDTRLCGVSRSLSRLVADPGWSAATLIPLVRTPDDAAARVVIGDFGIQTQQTANRVFPLHWRSGRDSIFKEVAIGTSGPWPGSFDIPLQRVRITGHGGGRWYLHLAGGHGDCMHPDCRIMQIEGTSEPLAFYMYHHQYLKVGGGPLTGIRNAANISFYGQKTETIIPGTEDKHETTFGTPWPILMGIHGSSNIRVIGEEGPSQAEPERGLFEISDTTDVTLVQIGRRDISSYHPESSWHLVKETFDDQTSSIDATGLVGMFRRNQ